MRIPDSSNQPLPVFIGGQAIFSPDARDPAQGGLQSVDFTGLPGQRGFHLCFIVNALKESLDLFVLNDGAYTLEASAEGRGKVRSSLFPKLDVRLADVLAAG